MMGIKDCSERTQVEFISLEEMVPPNHLVRKLEAAINFSFFDDCVQDLYQPYGGKSIDPVVLIKIAVIQYIFGIPSMRKTIEEITVNLAYRWFQGYGMHEPIPHFSTFGKNYSRRFQDKVTRKSVRTALTKISVQKVQTTHEWSRGMCGKKLWSRQKKSVTRPV